MFRAALKYDDDGATQKIALLSLQLGGRNVILTHSL